MKKLLLALLLLLLPACSVVPDGTPLPPMMWMQKLDYAGPCGEGALHYTNLVDLECCTYNFLSYPPGTTVVFNDEAGVMEIVFKRSDAPTYACPPGFNLRVDSTGTARCRVMIPDTVDATVRWWNFDSNTGIQPSDCLPPKTDCAIFYCGKIGMVPPAVCQ